MPDRCASPALEPGAPIRARHIGRPDRCAAEITEAPLSDSASTNMRRTASEEFALNSEYVPVRRAQTMPDPPSPQEIPLRIQRTEPVYHKAHFDNWDHHGGLVDNLVPLARHALKYGELVASTGSLVDAETDALVSTVEESCLEGAGVDAAISRAGGALLAEKRQALPIISGDMRCLTGDAVVTSGGPFGFLRCEAIIYAVGPNYKEMDDDLSRGDDLLRDAYRASMRRANGLKCKTVAFALVSAGMRRGRQSLDNVLKVAVQAIGDMAYPGLQRVHLVAFRKPEQDVLQRVLLSLATASAVDGAYPPRATEDGEEHLAHQLASVDKALHNPSSSSPPPGGPAPSRSPPQRQPSRSPPQRQSSRAILANRVVMLQSEPIGVGELDLEGEANKLRQALREAAASANVDVELKVSTATVDAFQSAVTLGARVVHFAGHGHEKFMMFEDGHGGAQALEPKALRNRVSACGAGTCKLVVLNSCKSEDVGQAFVAAGVEHVVAVAQNQNNGRISDRAGIEFCRAFYRSLANMDSLRTAFDIGCAAAQNAHGEMGSDGRFILLPEDKPHDEPIFSEIPGSFHETTRPPPPSNAPPPPTFYVGRDPELWVCVESILNHRLTTIGGGYGSGKSALAAKAAAHVSQHQNFDAVVWVKVTTKDRFFDDVAKAAACVIEKAEDDPLAAPMRAALDRRLSRYASSLSTRRMRSALDDDDFLEHEAAERRASLNRDYSSLDTHGLDTSALVDLAKGGEQVLVVLNDFERFVTAGADAERARDHCRLLLRGLLETCANIKVLMTCSSFSGIGRVPGVTEQVIPLGRMADDHTAFLLLQRDPELKRRVTNPYAPIPPRIAPRAVAAACASHPFIKRLNGLPYAVGLGVAILNKLFAYEKMAKEVCEGAGAHKTLPPSSKLEPLDRALRVLDFPEVFDPDLRRLRDELKYVVEHGQGYRPEAECRKPPAQATPWDVARSWFGSTSPAAPASAWDLSWFGSSAHPAPPAPSDPKSPQQRLRELNEVQEFITPAEYEQKKQEILAAI